jgi:hypothetical protein
MIPLYTKALPAVHVAVAGLLLASCDLGFVEGADGLRADYATCSSDAIDPDRDGWGWESAHSCRMPPEDDDGDSDDDGVPAGCAYVDGACSPNDASCRVYDDYAARAGVKAEIWDAMYVLNADDPVEARCRADLAVAMAMQEAHSFAVDGYGNLPYDASKDGRTDGSQNVCLFNMNIDFIKRSCKQDCARFQSFYSQHDKKYLNKRESLLECVRRLDEGLDYFGINGTLHFHRGGSTGWANPGGDERDFARAQKVVADHLRDHPELRDDGSRVSHSIGHR